MWRRVISFCNNLLYSNNLKATYAKNIRYVISKLYMNCYSWLQAYVCMWQDLCFTPFSLCLYMFNTPQVMFIWALCCCRNAKIKKQSFWHTLQQDDIRSYMEDSLKQGIQISLFRRERIGGDSHGISFW